MKVTCTRPNASELINGIPFVRQADGSVVATGVSAEAADVFADFEGYVVEAEAGDLNKAKAEAEALAAAQAQVAAAEAESVAAALAQAEVDAAAAAKKTTKK